MLFDRHVSPSCSYCKYGALIGNGEVACVKRGITSAVSSCKKYIYDPLKREPEYTPYVNREKITEDISEEDFNL